MWGPEPGETVVWLRLPQLVLAAAQGRPGPPRESGRRRQRKAACARWAGRALEAGRRVGLREVRAGVQGTEGARTTPGLGSSHPGSDGVWHRARAGWGDGQGAAAVAEGRIGAEALNSRCQSFCGRPRGLRRAAEAARCRQPFPLGVPAAPCGSRVRVQAPGRLVHPSRGSDQLTPGPAAPGPRTPAPRRPTVRPSVRTRGRQAGSALGSSLSEPHRPRAPPVSLPRPPARCTSSGNKDSCSHVAARLRAPIGAGGHRASVPSTGPASALQLGVASQGASGRGRPRPPSGCWTPVSSGRGPASSGVPRDCAQGSVASGAGSESWARQGRSRSPLRPKPPPPPAPCLPPVGSGGLRVQAPGD